MHNKNYLTDLLAQATDNAKGKERGAQLVKISDLNNTTITIRPFSLESQIWNRQSNTAELGNLPWYFTAMNNRTDQPVYTTHDLSDENKMKFKQESADKFKNQQGRAITPSYIMLGTVSGVKDEGKNNCPVVAGDNIALRGTGTLVGEVFKPLEAAIAEKCDVNINVAREILALGGVSFDLTQITEPVPEAELKERQDKSNAREKEKADKEGRTPKYTTVRDTTVNYTFSNIVIHDTENVNAASYLEGSNLANPAAARAALLVGSGDSTASSADISSL